MNQRCQRRSIYRCSDETRHVSGDDDEIPLKEELVIADGCQRHRATLGIKRHVATETFLATKV